MSSVALVALAAMAWATAAAHAGGLPPDAAASGTRWGEAAAFSLKATVRVRSVPRTFAGRIRSHGNDAGSNWIPRVRDGGGTGASVRGTGRPPFNLETLPVTIGGHSFILSRFTMSRAGVRGMISTAF